MQGTSMCWCTGALYPIDLHSLFTLWHTYKGVNPWTSVTIKIIIKLSLITGCYVIVTISTNCADLYNLFMIGMIRVLIIFLNVKSLYILDYKLNYLFFWKTLFYIVYACSSGMWDNFLNEWNFQFLRCPFLFNSWKFYPELITPLSLTPR